MHHIGIFWDNIQPIIQFSTIEGEKRHFSVLGLLAEKKAEFTVYVRGDGRVTIPKEVRDALCIEEGNLVRCEVKKVEV